MAKATKFTFGESFDEPAPRPEPVSAPPPDVVYDEDEVAALIASARAEGRAEGEAAAREGIEQVLMAGITRALDGVAALIDRAAASERRLGAEAARLGHAVGTLIAGRLMAAHPLAEIEAMLADCLAEAATEPRVVVRLAPSLVDAMKTRLDALADAAGHQGKLVLLGDERLAPGDARVEWANGGAERDMAAVATAVADAVMRHTGDNA